MAPTKLYVSVGPNPQLAKWVVKYKGLEIEEEFVDILSNSNRTGDYIKKNPQGGTPCLELDNGQFVSEINVVSEYLEDFYPESTPIFGKTIEEKAEARMMFRRIDLQFCEHSWNALRYGALKDMFASRMTIVPENQPGLITLMNGNIKWINDKLLDGKKYLCGDRFTIGDMWLYLSVKQAIEGPFKRWELPEGIDNVKRFLETVEKEHAASLAASVTTPPAAAE
eukprot:TRINITY_DN16641_c0_g1_i1.p2 TRINITY_DN16641_c0_g1~~TRINITY_DN16641_c0_g1_i1.p2  ORF type:complete len:224 (-),score=82.21 TRINITY_DN16641_c0_g1_i1:145-816(-)